MRAKQWTVEIFINERGQDTCAWAVLTAPGHTVIQGAGAHHCPTERLDLEIGDEIATGRALVDLGHRIERLAEAGGTPRDTDPEPWWEVW